MWPISFVRMKVSICFEELPYWTRYLVLKRFACLLWPMQPMQKTWKMHRGFNTCFSDLIKGSMNPNTFVYISNLSNLLLLILTDKRLWHITSAPWQCNKFVCSECSWSMGINGTTLHQNNPKTSYIIEERLILFADTLCTCTLNPKTQNSIQWCIHTRDVLGSSTGHFLLIGCC
jgi:hypothetical protein